MNALSSVCAYKGPPASVSGMDSFTATMGLPNERFAHGAAFIYLSTYLAMWIAVQYTIQESEVISPSPTQNPTKRDKEASVGL